jgi:NodT family efflux transporter outer membrane factor (OMF) lipoprotein
MLMTILSLLLLAGCAVGPDYFRPKTAVPTAYAAQSTQTLTQAPEVEWWQTFGDERLNALVNQATLANRDLRVAAARVREARALRAEAASDYYPKISAGAGYNRTRSSGNTESAVAQQKSVDAAAAAAGTKSSNIDLFTDTFQAGFDASWELDLFGRVRRQVEAAQADLEAAQEAERGTLITLLGEVARNYIDLRGAQRELAIANQNIRAQQETVKITDIRFRAGLTSELDVANARAQLATTRATVPTLETSIHQAAHRLSVLAGNPPETLLNDLLTTASIPAAPPLVPVGLPSELLRRRPDIRQSERQLAASNARIGAAVAQLFPQVSLNASAGLVSGESGTLFNRESRTWSVGPGVTVPIFQGGALRAQVQAANARQEQALAGYEQSVLNALEDSENALVAYSQEQARYRELANAVAANQRSFELSNALYTRGLTDFLNVLQAQQGLFLSQVQLVRSEHNLSANVVAIYKALGGGWEAQLPEVTSAAAPATAQPAPMAIAAE